MGNPNKGETLKHTIERDLRVKNFPNPVKLLNSYLSILKSGNVTDASKLFGIFLYYYFKSSIFKLEVKNKVNANIQDNVGIGDLLKLKIPLPTTLKEQTAIATALSDTDTWINSLEQLLTKKRQIKQGAMQELLQPKDVWEVKKLGEISKIYTGKKNNQDKMENGIFPFFVRSQTIERINSYSFEGEAILIPGEGNIGKIFHYIDGKFDFHQRVYKISDFSSGYFGKYIYRYIYQNMAYLSGRN